MNLLTGEDLDPYGDMEKQDYDDAEQAEMIAPAKAHADSQQMSQPQSKPQPQQRLSKQQIAQISQIKAQKIASKMMENVLLEKEKQLDNKLDKLNRLSKDELNELRDKRLDQLKHKKAQREKWIANNHGKLIDIRDQKQFFELVKTSKFVICLFYSKNNKYCRMLQEHLSLVARQHLECKFTQIDAENAPFLIERLNVWMMPTLVLAKEFKIDRQLVGLDWVAPNGKISTEFLEQKLFDFGFLEETYLQLKRQMKSIAKHQQVDDESDDDLDI